jgi:hypothetical protein
MPSETKVIDIRRESDERMLISLCSRCGGQCCNCATCLALKADTRDLCASCFRKAATKEGA